jgi:hypothetical protein
MSKRQWLILFGIWVMVFLFLGFPALWNKIIAVATGLLIVIGAYRVGDASAQKPAKQQVPYVEHFEEEKPERMSDINKTNLPLS